MLIFKQGYLANVSSPMLAEKDQPDLLPQTHTSSNTHETRAIVDILIPNQSFIYSLRPIVHSSPYSVVSARRRSIA